MGFLALGVLGVLEVWIGMFWFIGPWIAQNLLLNRIDTTALLFCT